MSAIAFAVGFLGRDWWLSRQVETRRALLQEELPTAIDLLTLSIVAGESVPAGLARVATVLTTGIGGEFDKVVADIRAGASTVEALDDMRRRLPLPGIARLVDALVSPPSNEVRHLPMCCVRKPTMVASREGRMLLEMGGRREVLMLVPVVFLILPVVVVFALLPGLVSLDLLVP